MMVRFTVTNRSGSMIRQLTLNVCCWLAEARLPGPQVCFEREADVQEITTPIVDIPLTVPIQSSPTRQLL